jgi:four helix bundle protein
MNTVTSATLRKHVELRNRTKAFSLRIVRLCDSLPSRRSSNVIATQLLRSGMSVAANYRAAGRARSKAEFIAKLGIVVEEADESVFWLELLVDAEIVSAKRLEPLLTEANELLAIFSASRTTSRRVVRVTRSPDHPITRFATTLFPDPRSHIRRWCTACVGQAGYAGLSSGNCSSGLHPLLKQ